MSTDASNSRNDSAEQVALNLMLLILEAEGRPLTGENKVARISRNLVLDLFADCIEAVHGKRETKRRLPGA